MFVPVPTVANGIISVLSKIEFSLLTEYNILLQLLRNLAQSANKTYKM